MGMRRGAVKAVAVLWVALAAWSGYGVSNPNGVAVIIGNKGYEHELVPEVSYAHRDAEAFRRYVVEVLGYDAENVIDLRDASQAEMETTFGNDRSHEGCCGGIWTLRGALTWWCSTPGTGCLV